MNINDSDRDGNTYYSAPLESYAPLETSVPLETTTSLESITVRESSDNIVNSTPSDSRNLVNSLPTSQQSSPQLPVLDYNAKLAMFDVHDAQASDKLQDKPEFAENVSDSSDFTLVETIPLLEERLVINRSQHKIGEVIIRKEIETHIIEVPVRREKLIIEQVNPILRQIAEVDLESEEVAQQELADSAASVQNNHPIFNAEFESVQLASQFLGAIAKLPRSGCQKVQLKLELANPQLQSTYQHWLEQFVASQANTYKS